MMEPWFPFIFLLISSLIYPIITEELRLLRTVIFHNNSFGWCRYRYIAVVDRYLNPYKNPNIFDWIVFAEDAEQIIQSEGRIFCLDDEPGVHRVWLPNEESPGLAMSRAFGDYCIKDYGLISVPEVTQRHITNKDKFVVLATDGVWDVVSNEEAVKIVSSTPGKAKAAKILLEFAARAWKKRKGIAMDDISAICLFFHSSTLSHHEVKLVTTLK